jgi:PAS domain S-box-containing protein
VSTLPDGELQAIVRDIRDRWKAEEELHRLNRELRAISSCNEILMRAEDEQTLLNDVCRVVCDQAGYHMAWVGYAEDDDAKTVRPAAWAGVGEGYFATASITWADTEPGHGPTGTAIRSGRTTWVQDVTTDPQAATWREGALQAGCRSKIALPLKDNEARTFGSLTICSTEPNAFTPNETRLLEELSGNLAFGIMALRTRVERDRVEEALRESGQRYREVFDNVTDSIFVFDVVEDGRFRFVGVNATSTKLSGVSDSAASGKLLEEVVRPEVVATSLPLFRRCIETGEVLRYEEEYPRPTGGKSYLSKTLIPVRDATGSVCRLIAVTGDVTERKLAEDALFDAQQVFRTLVENSPDIIARYDRDFRRTYVNPMYLKVAEIPEPELLATAPEQRSPLPADSAAVLQDLLRRVLESGIPEAVDVIWPKSDSVDHWYNIYAFPEFDREGLVVSVMTISRDITQHKRTEEGLRASEERYRSVVSAMSEGIVFQGTNGAIEACNASAETIMGLTRDQMMGRTSVDLDWWAIHEDGSPFPGESHPAMVTLRTGEPCLGVIMGLHKPGGTLTWISINSYPLLHSGDTKPYAVVTSFSDITERKRAEHHLQREIDRERMLLELYDRAQLLSDRELYDYALDQAVSLTYSSIGFFHRVSDDQSSVILTTWNAEALKGCTADYEAVYPLGDAGNWVDCVRLKRPVVYNDYAASPNKRGLPEGHFPVARFMSVPVLEGDKVRFIFGVGNKMEPYEDGDVVQLQLVAAELEKILERRQAEEALRASEERYRRFVEDDVAGAFVSTPDGRLLACNPAFARMIGSASAEEALATNVVDLYQDLAARETVLAEIRARGRIDQHEITWRRMDGSPLAVVETAIGDFDEDGQLTRIRGYLIDVTDRRRLEEQLRQAQKMEAIGRLAGGVAHDFNNLLTAISGYADILATEMDADDARRADVAEIRNAATRAATLTRQLLAFSRRSVLQPAVIDMNAVVDGIAPMLRRLVGEQIELRTVEAPDLGNVRADPAQIEQVLLNLAVNARDAMPGGGTLTIETANAKLDDEYVRTHTFVSVGSYVLLAVSDTGVGMDAATMAHLFEPFFTTKPVGEGTGLGLATVYGIVAQSGGHVAAYSEPGKGSTFKVFLPRVPAPVEAQAAAVAGPPRGGSETILLVEDAEAVRSFTNRILVDLGYTVSAAGSGAEALEFAAQQPRPIDLLVTDVMLPGMNGREVSERLTALWPSLRTLFISGYTQDSIVHRGELDMGVAFLGKPFTPDALGHAVREVLEAQTGVGDSPGR